MSSFQKITLLILATLAAAVIVAAAIAITWLLSPGQQAAPAQVVATPTYTPTPTPIVTRTPTPKPSLGDRDDIVDALYKVGIRNWEIHSEFGRDDFVGLSRGDGAIVRLRNDPVTLARLAVDPDIPDGGKILNIFLIETARGHDREILDRFYGSLSTDINNPDIETFGDIRVSHYFDMDLDKSFFEIEIVR